MYCPQCNEAGLAKLVSAAAFRLKGTGWYETDFKGNGKKEEKSADGKSPDSGQAGKDTAAGKSGEPANKADSKKSGAASSSGGESSSAAASG